MRREARIKCRAKCGLGVGERLPRRDDGAALCFDVSDHARYVGFHDGLGARAVRARVNPS